jgi:uncharacterized membrane protein (DUF485 family)
MNLMMTTLGTQAIKMKFTLMMATLAIYLALGVVISFTLFANTKLNGVHVMQMAIYFNPSDQ